jgi:hypothetical protein
MINFAPFNQAEIDYFICHEELAANMKPLIGLLRDKTPKFADGTIGSDIARMVKTFGRGMFVDVIKPKPMLGNYLSYNSPSDSNSANSFAF